MLVLAGWSASAGAHPARGADNSPGTPIDRSFPGGPALVRQWWLDEVVNTAETTPPKVTGTSPRLAIVAPGIDGRHPALGADRIQEARSRGIAWDQPGTAAAGIAAATGDDPRLRFLGVWPGMNLIHATADDESCRETSRAVRRAAQLGSAVIVMGYGFEPGTCQAHLRATQYAVHKGVVLVAAAGDEGRDVLPRPASDPHVVAVGSIKRTLEHSPFSNTGARLDLVAPGESVLAPSLEQSGRPTPEFSYRNVNGTRYPAAMVGAAAGWIIQERRQLETSQVRAVLSAGAGDLGVPGRDDLFGSGLLNVESALGETAPTADRYEPNDDIGWVNGRLLTNRGKPIKAGPIWPSRGKKTVEFQATLSGDDPADVYRIRVPARSRVEIGIDQAEGDVAAEVRKGGSRTITSTRGRLDFSDLKPPATEGLAIRNRTSGLRLVYLVVRPGVQAGSGDARYRVRIGRSLPR